MKIFLGFLLVCFFAGWLLHKLSMKVMTLFLVGLSIIISAGYFLLDWI